MPTRILKRSWLALATLALAAPALAGDGEGQIYVTPAWEFVDDDKDRNVEDTNAASITVGYAYTDRWNVEAFAHTASFSGLGVNGQDTLQLGMHGLAVLKSDSMI